MSHRMVVQRTPLRTRVRGCESLRPPSLQSAIGNWQSAIYHPPVPQIIDYDVVLERMTAGGRFRSLYYNSGAFGFPAERQGEVRTLAWVGPPDETIRPAARPFVREVPPPYEANLAQLARRAWLEHLPGVAWVMPMSHWSFELDFGSRAWMPDVLRSAGVDPAQLEPRNNGAAVEFRLDEAGAFETLVAGLLGGLTVSDFAIAFPGHPVVCMVHHHRQLWWQTTDDVLLPALDALVK